MRPIFLWQRDKPKTTADVNGGHCTQSCDFRRAPLRPSGGRAFGGAASAAILYAMRTIGARWGTDPGGRAWLLQPSGPGPASGMDCDLGAAVFVPGLRPHDEPIAGWAASVALVCRDGHRGSAVSALDSERDGARDRREIRTPRGGTGMAQSAAVAGAVVGVADVVGLAGITAGHKPAGREPPARPAASDAMARRDADRFRIGGECSIRVGIGSEVEPERARAQPGFGLARDAIPAGNRFRVRFWRKADRIPHRGRPWARATVLVMLGSIT